MRIKVGLSTEFEAELQQRGDKKGTLNRIGTAILLSDVGYVFIDRIANVKWLYAECPLYAFHCPYCSSPECPYFLLIETCIEQISRVTVHELIHLAGSLTSFAEDQVRMIEPVLFSLPFSPPCPIGKFFKPILTDTCIVVGDE